MGGVTDGIQGLLIIAAFGLGVWLLIRFAPLFGARPRYYDPRNPQATSPDWDRVRSPMTVAERGDRVGVDDDDAKGQAPKLADNVGLRLGIRYRNFQGDVSERAIEIDGVYGHDLGAPQYVIALDSQSGERRTFRVDRILAILMDDDAPITSDIGWWIGNLVRHAAGLPVARPARACNVPPTPLLFDYVDRQEAAVATRFEFGNASGKAFFDLTLRDPATARPRVLSLQPSPQGLRAVCDGETGEHLDDLIAFLCARAGVDPDMPTKDLPR